MGLLNRMFGSGESIAKEIDVDDADIAKHWNDFLGTLPRKKELIAQLKKGTDIQGCYRELNKLLKLELMDIHIEDVDERDLISCLESMEHSERVKRLHTLKSCLDYAATRHEYVDGLLNNLHGALDAQAHLLDKLLANPRMPTSLLAHLFDALDYEQEVVRKINEVSQFHEFFAGLLKGEHVIKIMSAKEQRLLTLMRKKLESEEDGLLYRWAQSVSAAIEDKIEESISDGVLEGYHADVDLEFVNRPEFLKLANDIIGKLRKRPVSEETLNVFVHLYRQWYNHCR